MRILLIEDDEALCYSLEFQLKKSGYTVDTCLDGEDALYYIEQDAHDLILLDRMLPGIDGITLLKKIRFTKHSTPVIIITALGELNDKITGLDTGADDYLVKPFAFEELLARIRCINRRPHRWEGDDMLKFADLAYNPDEHTLKGSIGKCTLSKTEGQLMEFFLKNTKQTLPRITLLSKVWGPDAEIEEGNLDNYMHFIRRRLKNVSKSAVIKTVRGIGYRMEDQDV